LEARPQKVAAHSSKKDWSLMLRHLSIVLPLAASSLLFACTVGTVPSTGTGNPSPTGSSTSSTDPTAPGKDGGSTTTGSSSLGPSCKEYVACCDELAKSQPQLAASCDSVQSQIEKAQASGVSTSSYESACKSGVSSFHSAGYCN
jgi:hypothetical protein